MMMADPLAVAGLRSRDGHTLLEDITLNLRQGEILGLAGPSEAGKTTLIKSILRLVTPTAGSVHLFGEPHEEPGSRARLAYLPEQFQPPSHLCGHDFVRLSLAFHRCGVRRSVVCALAESVDLDPAALRRPIRSYSKGMAQKLGVLATLLTGRPLLILDQPMSGLDPRGRNLLKQQIATARERGQAVLMSSQILADHDGLCDRVALLREGRLHYVGPLDGLRNSQRAPTLETTPLGAPERPRWPADA